MLCYLLNQLLLKILLELIYAEELGSKSTYLTFVRISAKHFIA